MTSIAEEAPQGQKTEIVEPQITSVAIPLDRGPLRGQVVELDINFQFGNTVSVIIPSHRKDLIESLTPGTRLFDMSFYSPMVFFRGNGSVTGRTRIKHGPRQGDYLLDITLDTT